MSQNKKQSSNLTINQIGRTLRKSLGALGRVQYIYTDPIDQYRARSLLRLAWGAVVVAVIALIYQLATPNPAFVFAHVGNIGIAPYTVILATVLVFSIVTLLVVTLLANRALLMGAGLAFVLFLFVTALMVYIPDGFTSFTMFALSMPIIAAGILLDRRTMLMILGLIAITLALGVTLESAGLLVNFTTGNPTDADSLVDGLVFLIIDGIMLNIYIGRMQLITRRNQTLAGEVRSLSTFSAAVTQIDGLDNLLEQAVDLIRDQLGYYHVQLFLVEAQTGLIVLRAGTGIFRIKSDQNRRRIAPSDLSIINEVVRDGIALRIDRNSANLQRSEFQAQTQTELLLPLRRKGEVFGVLDVQSIRQDAFSQDDMQVLETMGGELSILIQNARLLSESQQIVGERQHLQKELLTATTRLDQLTEDVTGGNWARFIEQRGGKAVGFDWHEGVLIPMTTVSPAIQQAMKNEVPELSTREGEQLLTVPIVLRGQILGAMEFHAPHERLWNTRTIELARIIAQRLALALDNIRLFEQAQITATREQVASQVSVRLQSRTSIDDLLAVAADSFQQALGATRTSILLGSPPNEKNSLSGGKLSSTSYEQPQHNGNGGLS